MNHFMSLLWSPSYWHVLGTYDHVLEPDEFVQHHDVGGAIYAQPKKLQQNGLVR